MNINETELIEFFGVLPEPLPREEKDFFGSSTFAIMKDNLRLVISFSTHHPQIMLELSDINRSVIITTIRLESVSEIRISRDLARLAVFCHAKNDTGSDLLQAERLSICLTPLNITVSA